MSMGEVRVRQPLQALLSRPGVSIRYSNDVIPVASSEYFSNSRLATSNLVDDDEDLPKLKN